MSTYTLFDEIAASHVHPLPEASQKFHLDIIRRGFHNLLTAPEPSNNDWRVVATAINMMETLIEMGVLADPDGLHRDTIRAMEAAGKRHEELDAPLRLDGPGIQAVRNLLEDYAEVLKVLPHRTMVRAHRLTEGKMVKLYGKKTHKKNLITGRF